MLLYKKYSAFNFYGTRIKITRNKIHEALFIN